MIELFDCNVRLGKRNKQVPGEPATVPELLGELRRLSISGALVRHQLAVETGPAAANQYILEELHGSETLLPTWSLLPDATGETGISAGTLDEMVPLGVRAVWLYPKTHMFSLRHWCARGLLASLEARRVPVFMHWDEVTPDELVEALTLHRRLDVVLSNVNYRTNRILYPLLGDHPNLHMDLGAPHGLCGFIEEVVGRFGPERLLFGSGFPDHEIGPALTYLLYADISEEDKAFIGAGNLRRLLEGVQS